MRKIAYLLVLLGFFVGCGDSSQSVSLDNSTVVQPTPIPNEQKDNEKICAFCIGNGDDGITDEECLRNFGIMRNECE